MRLAAFIIASVCVLSACGEPVSDAPKTDTPLDTTAPTMPPKPTVDNSSSAPALAPPDIDADALYAAFFDKRYSVSEDCSAGQDIRFTQTALSTVGMTCPVTDVALSSNPTGIRLSVKGCTMMDTDITADALTISVNPDNKAGLALIDDSGGVIPIFNCE